MLSHKGYIGTIEPDAEEGILFGKVVNAEGAIMYEGATIDELRESMIAAIDNYLEHCKETGQTPVKPFSGNIALRVDPLEHARIAAIAEETGRSMNQVIVDAIRSAS